MNGKNEHKAEINAGRNETLCYRSQREGLFGFIQEYVHYVRQ